MPFSAFDPVNEESSNEQAVNVVAEIERLKKSARPEVASRIAEIYRSAPYIPPAVILSMAKAGVSDQTVEASKKAAAIKYVRDNDPQRDDGNWFSRNVYGNFKAATRWTFAGLQLLPDLAQNVGAEIFSPNDPAGMDGWFKSTNLGTLISNSSQAGEGFFIGGKAAEKQAERARKFRGTINNHAWTIGRGAAQLAFTPGSKPYNVLSGFVDAAVAIGADPTALAGKPIAAARAARATIPGLVGADALTAARALAKGEAGLGSAEQIAFEATKFGKWVTSDKRAVRLTGQIVDIAKNADLTDEEKVLSLLEKFDYNISPQIAREFAKADDGLKVQGLLGEASSRLQGTPDEILLPKDVREIRGATATSAWLDEKAERVPLFRNVRNNRFFSQVPKNQVVINGSGIDKAQAIKNYSNYMKGIGFGPDSDEYKNVMGQVVRAYSLSDPGASRPAVQAAFDNALRVIATKAAGRTGADIDDVWKRMVAAKNAELAKSRVFTVDEIGWADDGGLVQSLLKYFPQEVIDDLPQDALDRLVLTGPGALNELADEVAVLPDFREVRKFAGILSRVSTKQPVEKVNALIESAQNELWKPLALATGGYIMRNMIDAQTRIAMNGMSGLFRHPQDFILWVMNKKGFEDIRGVDFEDVLRTNVEEWGENQREMVDALTFDTYKNLDRPVDAKTNQFRNGNWTEVNQGVDPNAHRIGYVDNLAQIHTDAVNGQISRFDLMGLTEERQTELIIQWLNQPEQAKILESLNRYAKLGLKVGDPENGNVGAVIQLGDNALEDFVAGWVSKLSRMKTSTITRGDKDLQVVAAYNRVPLITSENGVRVIAPIERINADDLANITDTRPGTIVDLGNDKQGVIINRFDRAGNQIDPFSGEVMTDVVLDIQPVFNDVAIDIPVAQFAPEVLGESYGSAELRELLTIKGNQGQLAQFVKRAERGAGQIASRRFGKAGAAADYFVDKFFVNLYGRGTQILEKSPVFRQYYFREILATADELAPDQAQMILSRVLASAEQEGIPAVRYVGGKDVLKKLKTVAQGAIVAPRITSDSEYVRFGNSWRSKLLSRRNLNDQEINAVTKYTGGGYEYRAIQDMLRGGDVTGYLSNDEILDIEDVIRGLDSLIETSAPIDEAVTTFRGISVDPTDDGAFLQTWLNAKPGEIITDAGYSSTTFDEAYATRRASRTAKGVVLEIVNPVGTRGLDPLAAETPLDAAGLRFVEKEWLLPRNTQFRVISRDGNKIKVQVVGGEIADTATGTVDELDAYAKAVALRETKNLLYNATERSNLEDILRVVIPFGAAWREVLGTYARATIEDPTRIRRAQLIFDGARKFDPDGDGEGFFYKDATTGEYSFNFPLSGWFSQLLTGLDTPLQAPVKRISIGLGVIPSVGPVGQIAASKLLPDTPSTDFIRGILLPYGEKTTLGFVPKWVSRLNEALEGNTMNLGTVYGNTYIETLRALSTSGEYDLADPNDQEQLYADARWKARIITSMRALGQFIGPTAPSPEFKISTKDGDMYATQLIKEFQKLQANNYDTAVSEFLRIYGNDALLYLSNKTESVAGGLEATEQFGDWERRNGDLLKKYPNVAGFMAPGGDNFSFEVWSRQVTSGKRRRLTDREIVEAAQYRAAASQYRAMRDKLPASPSAEQKAWLRRWRQKLNKEYPGFPVVAEFNPGEFPAKIEELKRMVQEGSLADNDVAQATALYLRKRDQALQSAASAGYSSLASNAAAPLRDWLIGHAQAIVAETPEFARIYDRLLAAEIED